MGSSKQGRLIYDSDRAGQDEEAFRRWLEDERAPEPMPRYATMFGYGGGHGGNVHSSSQWAYSRRDSVTDPYDVKFLPASVTGTDGVMGIGMHPGRRDRGTRYDWDRDLGADLDVLWKKGVRTIVCLVEPSEFGRLGIPNYIQECEARGFEVVWFPIVDVSTPVSFRMMHTMCYSVWGMMRDGNVLVHCRGGKGRSGTFICSFLQMLGYDYATALKLVRSIQPKAVETRTQENWCERFGQYFQSIGRRRQV